MEPENSLTISACPFCGCATVQIIEQRASDMNNLFWLRCWECEAETDSYDSWGEAVTAWNRRPEIAPVDSATGDAAGTALWQEVSTLFSWVKNLERSLDALSERLLLVEKSLPDKRPEDNTPAEWLTAEDVERMLRAGGDEGNVVGTITNHMDGTRLIIRTGAKPAHDDDGA